MQFMKMPGFTAEASLYNVGYTARFEHSQRQSEVVPAFRVTCSGNAVGGPLCTALGAGAFIFPCFGNSACMWFHAGLINPVCFSCTFV